MRYDCRHVRSLRVGFTLVELLLVLTLIAIIAAVVAPNMNAGLTRSRMNQSAEIVRTSWADARLKAIADGRPMRFQCRIGSGWGFVAAADQPTDAATNQAAEGSATAGGGSMDEQNHEGVVFRQLLVSPRPGDLAIGGEVGEGELSAAVVFRPDGTASDAELILEDEGGMRVRVTLRGLTGVAKVEDVEVEE